ncbi:MAG TPA: glycosyltransferase family A protein [Candidatus Nanopelagicaceae bacterium]|nr:glycosyltransferase family A protein [Candidatus Nanopelagicaceae bacterium]
MRKPKKTFEIDAEWCELKELRTTRRAAISQYPSVSVLIATARPSDLSAILRQVHQQSLDSFELLIGLHNFALSSDQCDQIVKLEERAIRVSMQNFAADHTLGTILSTLAKSSTGDLIAKMDDDDIYGPEHLKDLLDSLLANKADAVGKAMNYVYLEALDVTVRRAGEGGTSAVELWADWVCGGTILVKRDLAEKGGWFGEGKSAVDRFLLNGVMKNGGRIWRTFGTGYVYRRRPTSHTYVTNYSKYLKSARDQRVGIWIDPEFGTDLQ